jgi:hypothetical protein
VAAAADDLAGGGRLPGDSLPLRVGQLEDLEQLVARAAEQLLGERPSWRGRAVLGERAPRVLEDRVRVEEVAVLVAGRDPEPDEEVLVLGEVPAEHREDRLTLPSGTPTCSMTAAHSDACSALSPVTRSISRIVSR